MAKAYWIVRVDVTNPENYKAYVEGNGPAFRRYNAKFLVRGGPFERMEGTARARNVVVEFKDYATAVACYHDAEYAEIAKIRFANAVTDLIIIEGVPDNPA